MRNAALFSLFLLLSACVGSVDGPAVPDQDGRSPAVSAADASVAMPDAGHLEIVTLAIDRGADIDPALVREGCDMWRAKNVTCRIVTDPRAADAILYVDDGECVPNGDGTVTLARATWDGGSIVYYPACIGDVVLDERARATFVVVSAHELGHLFGIWAHVPYGCDDTHLTSKDGVAICGPAVMNPLVHPGFRGFVTAVDALAFDLRDRTLTLIAETHQGLVEKGVEAYGCELHATP